MKVLSFVVAMAVAALSATPACADDDARKLVAQLFDSTQLDGYWHIETFPERIPLIVALPADIQTINPPLRKFDRDIVSTHEPQKYQNVFWIKALHDVGERKTIEFTYPPEGILGTAIYERGEAEWKLVEVRLRES